jgi:hypothetical protein
MEKLRLESVSIQAGRRSDGKTDGQTGRPTYRQADRHTGIQLNKNKCTDRKKERKKEC